MESNKKKSASTIVPYQKSNVGIFFFFFDPRSFFGRTRNFAEMSLYGRDRIYQRDIYIFSEYQAHYIITLLN